MNQQFDNPDDFDRDDEPDALQRRLSGISLVPPSKAYQSIPTRLRAAGESGVWSRQRWWGAAALLSLAALVLLVLGPFPGESPREQTTPDLIAQSDDTSASPVMAAARFVEGEHYIALREPLDMSDSASTQVVAFFWYPCWPCATFEEFLTAWEAELGEGVSLTRVPAVWSEQMRFHGQAYFTARALGLSDQTHLPLFTAFQRDNPSVSDEADLQRYFADLGITAEAFQAAFHGDQVAQQLRRAEQQNLDYQVQSTPSLYVDGRYAVSPTTAGGFEGMLEVVDYLISR